MSEHEHRNSSQPTEPRPRWLLRLARVGYFTSLACLIACVALFLASILAPFMVSTRQVDWSNPGTVRSQAQTLILHRGVLIAHLWHSGALPRSPANSETIRNQPALSFQGAGSSGLHTLLDYEILSHRVVPSLPAWLSGFGYASNSLIGIFVSIPLWLPTLLSALATFISGRLAAHRPSAARRIIRLLNRACPSCGFDVAALPTNTPCPECGKPLLPIRDELGDRTITLASAIGGRFAVFWLRIARHRYLKHARPLSIAEREVMSTHFPPSLLARVLVTQTTTITLPGSGLAQRFLGTTPSFIDAPAGIALDDLVVVQSSTPADEIDPALLFHELVHIAQYDHLGTRRFLALYLRQWLESGLVYHDIGLERQAYDLQARFAAGVLAPQQAHAEVTASPGIG